MKNIKIDHIREDYTLSSLDENGLPANPDELFDEWLKKALSEKVSEPTAMVLSTISSELRPKARVVLLKKYEEGKLFFFTNYSSQKGEDLSFNDSAAVTFFWPELQRQIRVEGKAIKCDAGISDEYFNSRPEDSRISAIASPQSKKIENREWLRNKKEEIVSEGRLKRPVYWGGYELRADYYEFWQGRSSRLHDRIVYKKNKLNWEKYRIAP